MVYVHTMETPADAIDKGKMRINVYDKQQGTPLADARISLAYTGNPERIINEITTDSEGAVNLDDLLTPPVEYSMEPGENQPFSEYTIEVNADGYEEINISGIDVFSGETSIQNVYLNEDNREIPENNIVIPVNTLYGSYPAKIPETEIKPVRQSGEIVLSRVVIPETIVVHDGVPTDSTALDYYVRYKDYIKNVASSEIYPTWSESAIYANILVIQSFTLNRVFTEWYRGKGYDFTITSSTAYDQKWIYGRNVFEEIDYLVDSIFTNYLSRPGVRQPIFTSYCDGNRTTCRGLSQWGSQSLAEQGYSAIDIIHYYYGNDMYINSADIISGVPSSWPGYDLTIGSSGEKVRQLQQQLNRIARNYPAIPTLIPDGIYGPDTADAVRMFQKIFHLPQTGIVDYPTWFEISDIYVGVTRISEPDV